MGNYNHLSYNRTCDFCGVEFIAHRKDKQFCSKICKDRARHNLNKEPYKKICIICGNKFETYREAVKCCSSECTKKNHSNNSNRSRSGQRDSRCKYTWDEYVAKVRTEAEERQAQKEKEKAINNTIRIIWAIAEKKKDKICPICGSVFHSEYPNKIYCSKKCATKNRDKKRKRNNKFKGKNIRSRCRKYGVYYDPSVKPELVFARDKMVCKICGFNCDSGDRTWGSFGPYSPSVDHIIALANGGTHTWDNVQTAHVICNSYKRDLSKKERLAWLGLGKL